MDRPSSRWVSLQRRYFPLHCSHESAPMPFAPKHAQHPFIPTLADRRRCPRYDPRFATSVFCRSSVTVCPVTRLRSPT
jgi:hypothetical protein